MLRKYNYLFYLFILVFNVDQALLSESAFLLLRINEKGEQFVSQGGRHPNVKLMQYLQLFSRI